VAAVKEFFTTDILLKLASLILAVLFWMAVASEPEVSSVFAVPVEYKNMPADLEISSNIVVSVNLETRGPSGRLRELGPTHTAVLLDFSNVRESGERTFTITAATTNLPRGIVLVRAIPAQLHFVLEHRLEREVPVQVRFSGALAAGLQLASANPTPARLAITGPESRVKQVQFAVTDPVPLDSVTHDTEMRVSAFIPESQVRFQGPPEVTLKIVLKQ
jgi:YbbR domain-containing protein